MSFVDLVVLAEEFHPIPFRTRPLKPPAPMVLRPKPRESRSLPGLQRTFDETTIRAFEREPRNHKSSESPAREISRGFCFGFICFVNYAALSILSELIALNVRLRRRQSRTLS
jgi:hypothetical protein